MKTGMTSYWKKTSSYFVKDLLDQAYNSHDEVEMCIRLEEIIDICKATENSHFIWFARLLYRHLRGSTRLPNTGYQLANLRVLTIR